MLVKLYDDIYFDSLINFFKKVFEENNKKLNLTKKDQDILDIKSNYMKSGCFWCLINNNNEICGTIGIRKMESFYEIRRFFILKKYQNRGYGTNLLEIVFDYSIANKITLLKVATMKKYLFAQYLFKKFGFKKTINYNNSSADLFFQYEFDLENIYYYKLRKLKNSFDNTLILNPTESIPSFFDNKKSLFMEGLYISERYKNSNDKVIFGGRNEYIDFIEFIKDKWKYFLKADDVDLKSLSGLNAHLVYFLSIIKHGDKVILLPENGGGHFATAEILKNIGINVFEMIMNFKNMTVNIPKTIELINLEKIDYLFIDRSEGLYYEDFSWVKECNCFKIFDSSQYLSSILSNEFPNPFDMGFDVIISTLHKNYPGPQKGIIATKKQNNLWEKYLKQSKTYISNTHPKSIVDSLLPLLNYNKLTEMSNISKKCIIILEKELYSLGVPVIKRNFQYIATHHLWICCNTKEKSFQYYLDLEAIGILCNYRLLPYGLGYGLRVGVDTAVLCGLRESNIHELALLMSTVYNNGLSNHIMEKTKKFIKKIKTIA